MSQPPGEDAPLEAVSESAAPTSLSPTVIRLGVVSLLTDVAGDLVTTLLPFFLVGTLGASMGTVGLIDGAADALSSLIKVAAGRLGDGRVKKKRLVVAGYVIAALARPLIAFAATPLHVLAVRITDRVGKGIRTAPRDAWIADVTPPAHRGRAYGVHRALDNAGAFLGPILGLFLYRGLELPLTTVFLITIVPGALAIALLTTIAEPETPPAPAVLAPAPVGRAPLPSRLRWFFVALFVFGLATASDAFVLLLGREVGLDETVVLSTWIGFAGVRTLLSGPGAALSDRIGRRRSLLLGWTLYAAVYAGFSLVDDQLGWTVVLALYAVYYALTEGAERALVADLSPVASRGTAFGWFHGVLGLALLPASWGFGALADRFELAVAFRVAAGLAAAATLGLALVLRADSSRAER